MRWSSVGSEAWRNVSSGTAQAAQLALVLGSLGGAVLGLDLGAITAISVRAVEYRAAGADILIIEAPGSIDPRACDALAGATGVSSGAIRKAGENVVAAALPGSSIPTFESTPGLAGILLAQPPDAGLLVSAEVANALGLRDGSTLETRAGPAPVAGIYAYPADGRRPDFEFGAISPTAMDAPFDECWARSWPETDDLESLLRTTLLPGIGSDHPPRVLQLNSTLGARFTGADDFAERPTRLLPILAAALAFGGTLVATLLRRVELASALHSGVRRGEQWMIVMLESIAWMAGVGAVSVPIATWFAIAMPAVDSGIALDLAGRYSAIVCFAGALGTSSAVLFVRERHLFGHFKARK